MQRLYNKDMSNLSLVEHYRTTNMWGKTTEKWARENVSEILTTRYQTVQ